MSGTLLTVDEAAQQLRLHPKTVLRHIREGRLRAARIGKGYRISPADLAAFAGVEPVRSDAAGDARATCTLDVPDISAEAANRIALYLGSATVGGGGGASRPPLYVSTAFDPHRRMLKVTVIGDPGDVASVLELFQVLGNRG